MFLYLKNNTFSLFENLNSRYDHAVARAKGQWIYFLCSDCRVLKHTFFEWKYVIRKKSDVDVISGRFYDVDLKKRLGSKSPELAREGLISSDFQSHFLYRNPLKKSCTLFRKDIWQKYGGLRSEKYMGFWELLIRLASKNIYWYYIPRYICTCPDRKDVDQLFDFAGNINQSFMKLSEEIELISSAHENKKILEFFYYQFCKYIDLCFQEDQYAQAYSSIFDFFDGLTLKKCDYPNMLKAFDNQDIRYREELLDMIDQLT